jgi:hypothetical protein
MVVMSGSVAVGCERFVKIVVMFGGLTDGCGRLMWLVIMSGAGGGGCDRVMWMVVTVYLVVWLLDVAGYVVGWCLCLIVLLSDVTC